MAEKSPSILVTGATGRQGGATARRLLADGWRVRALVRDTGSAAAAGLVAAGADLVAGDLDDRAGLDAALRGVHGVFSVQPAFIPPDFAPNELQRGVNVADAAHAAGVRHLLYASVAGARPDSEVPHWRIKWEIEQHIHALGVPATVLRPVMFMETHADRTFGVRGEHSLLRTLPSDRTIQLIAVSDIGAFAGLAFAEPDRFIGRTVEIAGDELYRHQIAAAVGRASGRDAGSADGSEAVDPAPALRGPGSSFSGWQADIPALRAIHPGLQDFETWLGRAGRDLLDEHFADTESH
jgi:uncharacterized protein YbjT (DUF2867 family)